MNGKDSSLHLLPGEPVDADWHAGHDAYYTRYDELDLNWLKGGYEGKGRDAKGKGGCKGKGKDGKGKQSK